eukprot:8708503-Prorocentrum_lima.AAC.1
MPVRFHGIPVLGAALQGRNVLILGPFCPEAGPYEQVDDSADHALWSIVQGSIAGALEFDLRITPSGSLNRTLVGSKR